MTTARQAHPGIYNSWRGMRERCRSLRRADAHCYALKGIRVCTEWDSFEDFSVWALAHGYAPGLTIERSNGMLGYSPSNCEWVDRKAQARNLSKNFLLTHEGRSQCLSAWAEEKRLPSSTLHARITRLGWPLGLALLTPVGAIKTGPKPRACA